MSNKILSYSDVVKVKAGENSEELFSLKDLSPEITYQYIKKDMLEYLGDDIYVRDTVAKMLIQVGQKLKIKNTDYKLKVVYGYRHPDIQKAYFDKRNKEIKQQEPDLSEEELHSKTNSFVAALDVAGHIVGGAIDLTIVSSEGDLDMGTGIADFSEEEKIKTFYPKLSDKQRQNRMLLHDLMLEVGFAPFYGEWWHFSYGDKEWAAFYNHSKSLYSPIDFKK